MDRRDSQGATSQEGAMTDNDEVVICVPREWTDDEIAGIRLTPFTSPFGSFLAPKVRVVREGTEGYGVWVVPTYEDRASE